MAYSELIKNFEKIWDYMREFYAYGFRTRSEFDKKAPAARQLYPVRSRKRVAVTQIQYAIFMTV